MSLAICSSAVKSLGFLFSAQVRGNTCMSCMLVTLLKTLQSAFRSRAELVLENAALWQQLAPYVVRGDKPQIRPADRVFWVVLQPDEQLANDRQSSDRRLQRPQNSFATRAAALVCCTWQLTQTNRAPTRFSTTLPGACRKSV